MNLARRRLTSISNHVVRILREVGPGRRAASAIVGAALACVVSVIPPAPARGDMITFVTPTGSTTGGQPVNATVTITTSLNTVTVALTNLQADPTSDVQNVNGLVFSFSNFNPTTASITGNSGIVDRTVNGNGTFSDASATTTDWTVSVTTTPAPAKITLTTIGNSHAPQTVIGSPNSGTGIYSNANSSIAGSNHNPFLADTPVFTLHVQGVTASTDVGSVIFAFGTADTTTNVVTGHAVPEPSSLALAALGGGACLAIRRRRARRR
jgi:hypothetical protein